jgi:ketosteroid isomerase-like protein
MSENVELVKRAYEFINRGEIPRDLVAPDMELVQNSALLGTAGVFHGPDGAERSLGELQEGFDEIRFEPVELIEAGDFVVAACRFRGRGKSSGAPFDARVSHLWTIREGVIARLEVFAGKREALRAAGLDAG